MNRLPDLGPAWLYGGKGVRFLCPHCRGVYLAVMFSNPLAGDAAGPEYGGTGSNQGHRWLRTGTDFTNLTLSPSLDASSSGHWHGFVINGECR